MLSEMLIEIWWYLGKCFFLSVAHYTKAIRYIEPEKTGTPGNTQSISKGYSPHCLLS